MVYDMTGKRETGTAVTLYLRKSVIAELDRVAQAQERSRSWVADAALADKLGVMAAQASKGKGWDEEL